MRLPLPDLLFVAGTREVTRWGLFLRRGVTLSFSFHRVCSLSLLLFESCFVVRAEGGGCRITSGQTGQASFKTLFDDDTTIIESST